MRRASPGITCGGGDNGPGEPRYWPIRTAAAAAILAVCRSRHVLREALWLRRSTGRRSLSRGRLDHPLFPARRHRPASCTAFTGGGPRPDFPGRRAGAGRLVGRSLGASSPGRTGAPGLRTTCCPADRSTRTPPASRRWRPGCPVAGRTLAFPVVDAPGVLRQLEGVFVPGVVLEHDLVVVGQETRLDSRQPHVLPFALGQDFTGRRHVPRSCRRRRRGPSNT